MLRIYLGTTSDDICILTSQTHRSLHSVQRHPDLSELITAIKRLFKHGSVSTSTVKQRASLGASPTSPPLGHIVIFDRHIFHPSTTQQQEQPSRLQKRKQTPNPQTRTLVRHLDSRRTIPAEPGTARSTATLQYPPLHPASTSAQNIGFTARRPPNRRRHNSHAPPGLDATFEGSFGLKKPTALGLLTRRQYDRQSSC